MEAEDEPVLNWGSLFINRDNGSFLAILQCVAAVTRMIFSVFIAEKKSVGV